MFAINTMSTDQKIIAWPNTSSSLAFAGRIDLRLVNHLGNPTKVHKYNKHYNPPCITALARELKLLPADHTAVFVMNIQGADKRPTVRILTGDDATAASQAWKHRKKKQPWTVPAQESTKPADARYELILPVPFPVPTLSRTELRQGVQSHSAIRSFNADDIQVTRLDSNA
jgi:hypothetical protein